MRLVNKNILLISPEPWSHIFVSKHHYATHLAERGNQVVFLNPPSPRGYRIFKTEYDNLRVANYPGFWKGLRFFPKFLRKKNESNVFIRIEKIADLKFDVIWSFDNSVFFDFDALPNSLLKISHIVDLNMNFRFRQAASSADFCFSCTQKLVNKQRKFNSNTHFIQHGYDAATEKEWIIESTKIKDIKVGYAGNLDIEYIDWSLIQNVVNKHSNCQFYFAGSGSTHLHNENAHFIGRLDRGELLSFYKQMDVLIIAYKADVFSDQLANPHKVMDYLGSGKPIIATYTKEYKNLDLIYMTKKNNEWPLLFEEIINDLSKYNTKVLSDMRKNYALVNTYKKQIDKIQKLIDETLS